MVRFKTYLFCTIGLLLLSCTLHAQIKLNVPKPDIGGGLLKIGKKAAGGKVSEKAWANWLDNSPVSTSFDQALYEVELLSAFSPPEASYEPLATQPRHADGGYVLYPGDYTMQARSFCLRAGTHGPSQGDGHLYAPMQGKSADFVEQILRRYGRHPNVPQQQVQVLLWAVIAGADMNTLAEPHKRTLYQLFTLEDLARFKVQHMASGYVRTKIADFSGEVRGFLAPVIEAETKVRDLVQKVNTTYEDFERIAMLPGAAPQEHMIRQVSRGRWSYHPDGYFVRYFPQGYRRTRVDVVVPPAVLEEFDEMGRISAIDDPALGRVEFEYGTEMLAAGSAEGYNQYLARVVALTIDGERRALAQPLELPFVTTETLPTTGSVDGQAELEQGLADAHSLETMADATPTMTAQAVVFAAPLALGRLVTVLRWAAKLGIIYNDLSACCQQEDVENCVMGKLAKRLLMSRIKRSLQQRSGLDAAALAAAYGNPVIFDPSGSIAVPANRSSQRIGIAPLPVDPPGESDWTDQIPPCPCRFEEATGVTTSPKGQWLPCESLASQKFHYGATYEARWAPATKGAPGQQCTYDQDKNLISYGLAAGSADLRSPGACGFLEDPLRAFVCGKNAWGHYWSDVYNWNEMPCEEYARLRPSSYRHCANSKPLNDWHYGQMCRFVQGFTCEDIRDVFKTFRDASDVPPAVKQFMEKGQLDNAADIDALLQFLEQRADEYLFGFNEPDWQKTFIQRVRDYAESYRSTGQNPAACDNPYK